jgi:hypothetical protein
MAENIEPAKSLSDKPRLHSVLPAPDAGNLASRRDAMMPQIPLVSTERMMRRCVEILSNTLTYPRIIVGAGGQVVLP